MINLYYFTLIIAGQPLSNSNMAVDGIKTGTKNYQNMIYVNLPEDIQRRIIADYGQNNYEVIAQEILQLKDQRIIRCVLFLAQGNRKKLDRFIRQAQLDFRDVIYWAEYDGSGRINDFSPLFQ
jgi:hypothetical protein